MNQSMCNIITAEAAFDLKALISFRYFIDINVYKYKIFGLLRIKKHLSKKIYCLFQINTQIAVSG
jgi:hypothetical protein